MADISWENFYNDALQSEPAESSARNRLAVEAILERMKSCYFDEPVSHANRREQHALLRALSDLRVLRIAGLNRPSLL